VQVHAVLQDTINKLALLAVIVVEPHTQAQALTQSVGEEISKMITQQKQLEQRFHELIAEQQVLRQLPNKANLQRNQQELQEVSQQLRHATKQLCRNLKDNPNVTENMAKVAAQREALQMLLSSTLDSLELQGTAAPVVEAVLAAEQAEVHSSIGDL
jgi:NAD-specific glutamate dehydrogenase